MLYICIPAFDEAPTVGLLLWRIRTVFEAHPREYEIIALDDGSTDGTEGTLRRYEKVLPLTVLRNETRRGYGAALDTLARAAAKATRYPRRDAMIVMQGDLTDRPEDLPELAKRFDGGVDCVVAEAGPAAATAPREIRRLRRIAPWLMRRYIRVDGVADPLGTLRLYRIAVMGEATKRLSPEFRRAHPDIEWKQIAGLRDRSAVASYVRRGFLRGALIGLGLLLLIPIAEPLIVLIYGADFAPAVFFFRLLLGVMVFSAVDHRFMWSHVPLYVSVAGDVLVSTTRPNLNAVALVPDELDDEIATGRGTRARTT